MRVRAVLALPILALGTLIGATVWSAARLSTIDAGYAGISSAFVRLERALGYVGFIHHFKNMVLRPGEPRYLAMAEEDYFATLAAIDEIDGLLAEHSMNADTESLRATVLEYGGKLDLLQQMQAEGASIVEVDRAVRVSDEAAYADIRALQDAVILQFDRRRAEEVRLRALMVAAGTLLVVLAVGMTLREARRSQSAQRRLGNVLDRVDMTVCITDAEGRLAFYNRAFARDLAQDGWTVRLGQNLDDIGLHLAPLLEDPRVVQSVVGRHGEGYDDVDVVYRDGRVHHVAMDRLPGGGMLIMRRDVTEERAREQRIAEERAQLIDRLRASNEELDSFANVASHDLQEPLRGIAINAGFLLREDLSPKAADRLRRMVALCKREQDMIDTLLKFARLGRVDNASGAENPADHVNTAIESLEDLIAEKGAEVVIETALPRVFLPPGKLRSLFHNLIENGLRYNTSASPRVTIGYLNRATVEGVLWTGVFYVRDNGIGIAEAERDRIWDMFTRGETSAGYGHGTGAGLTFVRRIIDSVHGAIVLESTPGEGSCFYFTLPLAEIAGTVGQSDDQTHGRVSAVPERAGNA